MAQVDKIQIGTTTYDILQSEDAIFTGVSNDTTDGSAASWTTVEKLASTETNGSIFTKISSMFKNIRFLYSKIGNLDIGTIGYSSISEAITDLKENKADTEHTHDSSELKTSDGTTPLISNNQVSDQNRVPSSKLIYDMNTSISDALNGKASTANFTSAAAGLVPKPSATQATTGYVLTGAGWQAGIKYNTDTTYAVATTAANGLMSSGDKTKLNGIETSANKYTHPSYTSYASGFRKFTVDATGHVSATAAVAKSDITALGIPGSNTTYAAATTAANGLMSKNDKTKLDGITSGATSYTTFTSGSNGLVPGPNAAQATTGYVLTGAGWQAGIKYNTDTTYTLPAAGANTLGGIKASLSGTTLTLST